MSHEWNASYFLNFGTIADMCNPLTLWLSIEIENPHLASQINQVSIMNLFAEILLNGISFLVSFLLILNILPCDLNTKDLIKCLKNVDTFLDNGSKRKF